MNRYHFNTGVIYRIIFTSKYVNTKNIISKAEVINANIFHLQSGKIISMKKDRLSSLKSY